jgi:N-acetylmuramic acid 6-phosphate etherase
MLEQLLTEQRNPASRFIDTLPTRDILTIINDEDRKVAGAVGEVIPAIAAAVDRVVESLRRGGRLFYIGAGSSGRLGVLDAAECPPTFNVPPDLVEGIMAGGERALARSTEATEDDPDSGKRDLRASGFEARDVLVGIAASGRTPYVLGAIEEARSLGALTVGVSCTPNSTLAQAVDIAITPLTGPEAITGSTRMKAGTATKMVLNMISTATMVRLGHVYGNLMVNVQPKNTKLRDRAERIVAEAVPADRGVAADLLDRGGSVRAAIVMGRLGVTREEAETLLTVAGGSISEALKGGDGQVCD